MSQVDEFTSEQREGLRQNWSKMLGDQEFDCFFTLTFKYPAVSAELAIERTKKLLTDFYKEVGGRVAAFVVAEQHTNGTYHTHGLMRLGVKSMDGQLMYCHLLWRSGFDRFGRCRFEVIKDPDAVSRYISKYLLKSVADYALVGKGLRQGSQSQP